MIYHTLHLLTCEFMKDDSTEHTKNINYSTTLHSMRKHKSNDIMCKKIKILTISASISAIFWSTDILRIGFRLKKVQTARLRDSLTTHSLTSQNQRITGLYSRRESSTTHTRTIPLPKPKHSEGLHRSTDSLAFPDLDSEKDW